MKYSIITPVRNEIDNIQMTIDSVVNQTILPVEWIILDDSSTDGTEKIIEKAAEKYDWIRVLKPKIERVKDYSSRVVNLFNYGYQSLTKNVEYVSKLDGDVSFNFDFYKNILLEFEKDPLLGIASGHLRFNNIPERISRKSYVYTRGATKIYRIKCLTEIGGIISFQGWDTLDNVAARAKGWKARILPEYFEHLKEEGSKVGNNLYKNYRTGFYNGSIPYWLFYFIIKSISKAFKKPLVVGSVLQMAGYFKGRFFSNNRPFPDYIVEQLHKEQKESLKEILLIK